MEKLVVVKIGGRVIDDKEALDGFLSQFAALEHAKILVHGGGNIASQISEKLGITPQLTDGRRITDEQSLQVVTMVYGGLINKQLVAQLQGARCNALGLTGADGNVVLAKKRPVQQLDYGFVGDVNVEAVDHRLLKQLIESGICPVMAALTHDGEGQLLNTNADTMASVIAQAMAEDFSVQLIYCFEQPGVMLDLDKGLVFESMSKENTNKYINEGKIHSGMLPKLENAFHAKANKIDDVRIGHYSVLRELVDRKKGTEIL